MKPHLEIYHIDFLVVNKKLGIISKLMTQILLNQQNLQSYGINDHLEASRIELLLRNQRTELVALCTSIRKARIPILQVEELVHTILQVETHLCNHSDWPKENTWPINHATLVLDPKINQKLV